MGYELISVSGRYVLFGEHFVHFGVVLSVKNDEVGGFLHKTAWAVFYDTYDREYFFAFLALVDNWTAFAIIAEFCDHSFLLLQP